MLPRGSSCTGACGVPLWTRPPFLLFGRSTSPIIVTSSWPGSHPQMGGLDNVGRAGLDPPKRAEGLRATLPWSNTRRIEAEKYRGRPLPEQSCGGGTWAHVGASRLLCVPPQDGTYRVWAEGLRADFFSLSLPVFAASTVKRAVDSLGFDGTLDGRAASGTIHRAAVLAGQTLRHMAASTKRVRQHIRSIRWEQRGKQRALRSKSLRRAKVLTPSGRAFALGGTVSWMNR